MNSRLIYTFTKLYISRHILGRGLSLNKTHIVGKGSGNAELLLRFVGLTIAMFWNWYISVGIIKKSLLFTISNRLKSFVTHTRWIDQRGENNYILFSSLTIKLSYRNSSLSTLQCYSNLTWFTPLWILNITTKKRPISPT